MNNSTMDFERLLEQKNIESRVSTEPLPQKNSESQKAEKSADLRDFIEMVHKIVKKTIPDVEFMPDEGRRIVIDPDEEIKNPIITFQVISRKTKNELKPRIREDNIIENLKRADKKGRKGEIWGQKFRCIVQFNIFASEYEQADEVMYNFEEAIFLYTYYLKKNGVSEVLFDEHLTDKEYDVYRQNVSVRNLRYCIDIEKLRAVFNDEFENVSV